MLWTSQRIGQGITLSSPRGSGEGTATMSKTLSQLQAMRWCLTFLRFSRRPLEQEIGLSRGREIVISISSAFRITAFEGSQQRQRPRAFAFAGYVFTHELVHIVRFCNFSQRFEVSTKDREKEERLVHATTYEILKELSLPRLDYILNSYETHRVCDMVEC